MSPWELASEVPSENGLATDVFGHLVIEGAFVLRTPQFFLLARPVRISGPDSETWTLAELESLANPFERFTDCNAWCLGLVTGDAVAAYKTLVSLGGDKEFVCWQSERGIKVRRSGPSFLTFLSYVRRKTRRQAIEKEVCPG